MSWGAVLKRLRDFAQRLRNSTNRQVSASVQQFDQSEQLTFTCEECGKQFDPDPDAMVELQMGAECPCCDGVDHAEVERMLESGEAITAEQLAELDEEELKELGLTTADREKLLNGEPVGIGGMCLCRECQDRLAEEQK